MALDLSKYGATPAPSSSGTLDLSKYGVEPTSHTSQTPVSTPQNLFESIWGDLSNRGKGNVDLYNQYTAKGDTSLSNQIAGGTAIAANTFGGITDVFGQIINSNPVTRTAANAVAAPLKAGFDATTNALSNTKLFQEAAKNPEATKTLEDYLAAGKSLGDIANNILLADGARAVAVKGQQVGTDLYKKLTTQSEESINSSVITNYNKGVKPSLAGQNTAAQASRYKDNVQKAVNTIVENKDSLKYVDDGADALIEPILGQTPKNLKQFVDAIEQTKSSVFQKYDALAKQAGEAGLTVDPATIASELDTVIKSKSLALTNPRAIQYAQQWKDRLVSAGGIDAQTTQEVVQNLNKSLEAFYKNPTYDNASQAAIDAMVANRFRTALDEGISSLGGNAYQPLKTQYGALKTIEKDVIKASLRDARKNIKGLIDFTDVFSGGQVVSGILSLNPGQIASGLTQKAVAEYIKFLNNPNRAVEALFKSAEKRATRSPSTPPAPTILIPNKPSR